MSAISYQGTIDIIVPAYREALNLELLVTRLEQVRKDSGLPLTLTIVDDNSQDGSVEVIQQLNRDWVRIIVRTTERGLSSAVLEGFKRTGGHTVVVMDADLSHPPETIPAMIAKLDDGADFVVGSRYIPGGGTEDDWGVFRWLNSRVATFFARPFTKIKDPMSGFFALRRETYDHADPLNPVGYKIGLELLVKGQCKKAVEVPIKFVNRIHGESKLSLKEQLRYLRHLYRLFVHKYATGSELFQFLVVGASGVLVNLVFLTLFLLSGIGSKASLALAIAGSVVTNFLLNRKVTFSQAKEGDVPNSFANYLAMASVGSVVNYLVAVLLLKSHPGLLPQLAAVGGITAATVVNFVSMKFVVFKRRHYTAPLSVPKPTMPKASVADWPPLVMLAVVLGAYFAGATAFALQQNVWTDEATQLSGISLSPAEVVSWLTSSLANPFPVPADRTPPISYWLGQAWAYFVGGDILSLRYLSIVAAAGGLLVVWRLARRLFGLWPAFLGTLWLALSPNLIVQSVEIRAYAIFLLGSTLLIYVFVKAAEERWDRWAGSLWWVAAAAMAVSFTHFFGVVLSVGAFTTLLGLRILRKEGPSTARVIGRVFAPVTVYVLSLGLLVFFVLGAAKISGGAIPSLTERLTDAARWAYRFFGHQSMLGIPFLAPAAFAVGAVLLFAVPFLPRIRSAVPLFALLVVTAVFVLGGGFGLHSFKAFTPSYNLWVLPLTALLLAAAWAGTTGKWRWAVGAGMALLIVANVWGTFVLGLDGKYYAHTRSQDLVRAVEIAGRADTTLVYTNASAHYYFALFYFYGSGLDQLEARAGALDELTPTLRGRTKVLTDIATGSLLVAASARVGAEDLNGLKTSQAAPTEAVTSLEDWETAHREGLTGWKKIGRQVLLAQSSLVVDRYERIP